MSLRHILRLFGQRRHCACQLANFPAASVNIHRMLQQLISYPRNRHIDAASSISLDLAYLTPNLIVMSTPASSFPKTLWRNPTDSVLKFLNANHGESWRIWSFRGEESDYLDKDLNEKGEFIINQSRPFYFLETGL